jgi:regulator of vacuolar morphogenesis
MAPSVEISIPTATVTEGPNPHTLYSITLRLPLRSFVVQKRYSEFASFHETITSQVGAQPPAPLPGKSWFSNTNSNATLREERRKGLEKYLQAINAADDSRWRNSVTWRAFLNLPISALSADNSAASNLHKSLTGPGAMGGPITDPTLWLDLFREMKTHMHDARLYLTKRDQATTPQKQHENSAYAKSSLVRAGTMIGSLEEALKNFSDKSAWGKSNLGDGEIRRRKDLLANVKKEKDGLENLLNMMATKSRLDSAVASTQDRDALVGSGKPRLGRVLGKETDKTRELDNQGVLQLQKQTMEEQDRSAENLLKIITRQKELGVTINNELEIQNELLRQTDEDTERLVARLRSIAKGKLYCILTRLQIATEDRCCKQESWKDILK